MINSRPGQSRVRPGARLAASIMLGVLLLAGRAASALETDQFMTWSVDLADSAEKANTILNREIEIALREIHRQDVECPDLPPKIFKHLFPSAIRPRFRKMLTSAPEVEVFPPDHVGYWEYVDLSIYRAAHWPWFLPMARTVRIGDVYLGLDKLGHMFNSSRPYYLEYREHLRQGLSEDQALRKVVLRGAWREKFFLGGMTDCVVSHADLEANYQGLRLALDLCQADPPYIVQTELGWELDRPVDLRDYVLPAFDESYNGNLYVMGRWKKMELLLREEYCPEYAAPAVQQRWERYRSLDQPSPSEEILADYFSEEDRRRRSDQAIDAVCARE